MDSIHSKQGSTAGAVIVGVIVLAAVIFGGLRLNQARNELQGEVAALDAQLSTAEIRIEQLQSEVSAERSAREQAEAMAKETEAALNQTRQELQGERETWNGRLQELQASIEEYEQRVAAADDAKAQAEAQLAGEVERRGQIEQELARLTEQLQQQETLAGQLQGSAGAGSVETRRPEVASASPQRTEARANPNSNSSAPASGATAAKQRFPAETTDAEASAGPAFDTPPKPMNLAAPRYPSELRREGVEGSVVVAFTVDTEGRVQDVEVRESTHNEFEAAALAAVRTWRFKPAVRNGEPVEVRISQRLSFTSN